MYIYVNVYVHMCTQGIERCVPTDISSDAALTRKLRHRKKQMDNTDKIRDTWIDAAEQLLISGGVRAVSIQSLAKQMNTSRTSFYWLFKDRSELLDALLARWDTKNTGGLIAQAEKYAATINEAILNVHDCWFDPTIFDSEAERAFLSWSQQDETVAELARRNDERRVKALEAMFERYDYESLDAHVRARTVYYLQIGYIMGRLHEPSSLRLSRVAYYAYVFTGKPCTREDLERFIARHNKLFDTRDISEVVKNACSSISDYQFVIES